MLSTSRRRLSVLTVVAAATAVFGLGACDTRAPGEPSLPPVFGARVTDGELRFWTGSPCSQVDRVAVNFSSANTTLVLRPPEGEWASVEYLALDGPYPGLQVVEPLPDGFDWRTAETVDLWVDTPQSSGSTPADVAEIVSGSSAHPDDTYWFQGIGWLNPAQVEAGDGKDFLAKCTADPAYQLSLPPAFGARVTDGRLQLWTGSPCADTNGVSLLFSPDRDKPTVVQATYGVPGDSTVDFERMTLGEIPPGMADHTPLPTGFDWRTQDTLALSVHRTKIHHAATTDLATVIAESGQHPDDTYWFQGIGWLDPERVAAQDGKTFLAVCTPDP